MLCEQITGLVSLVSLKIFFSGLVIRFYLSFLYYYFRNKLTNVGSEMLMALKELNNKKIKTEVYI